jgi:hypothetical protein
MDIRVIQHEWRRFRCIQNFQLLAQNFYLATGKIVIGSSFGTVPDQSFDLEHELVTHPFCPGKGLLGIGVDYDLQQTFAVTQVNKYDATVIPATM